MINILIDGSLVSVLMICLYTDLKERKIYNKVTIVAIAFALLLNTSSTGIEGLVFTLKGMLLGLGLLILPFVMGGLGAGDVKLIMAIGALKGAYFAFYAVLGTFFVGGIIAIAILVYKRVFLKTVKNIFMSIFVMFIGKVQLQSYGELSDSSISFPYGVAIFGGTIATLLVV